LHRERLKTGSSGDPPTELPLKSKRAAFMSTSLGR
jgi:hypothetical protein